MLAGLDWGSNLALDISGPQVPPLMFFWFIESSIGVNKLINKTGLKQIIMDITEFKANALFCQIEMHLTIKQWF